MGRDDDDGGSGTPPPQRGAVWAYTESGGVWSEQAKIPAPADATGTNINFGWSLAVSSDGNTALIGSFSSGAWVFTRSGSTWNEQQQFSTPADAVGANTDFGMSVALAPSGNLALIAGSQDSSDVGAVWSFTRSGSVWSEAEKIAGPADEAGTSRFGGSIALAANGTTAVFGGSGDGSQAGAAWVYALAGGSWGEVQKLTPSDESGAGGFGDALAASSDGTTVLVAAP